MENFITAGQIKTFGEIISTLVKSPTNLSLLLKIHSNYNVEKIIAFLHDELKILTRDRKNKDLLTINNKGKKLFNENSRLNSKIVLEHMAKTDYDESISMARHSKKRAEIHLNKELFDSLISYGFFNHNIENIISAINDGTTNLVVSDNKDKTITGVIGENFSFKYEENRTGQKPTWASLEIDQFLHYDIESIISKEIDSKLFIEVKTTFNNQFYISRKEITYLEKQKFFNLHIWILNNEGSNKLIILDSFEDMQECIREYEYQEIPNPLIKIKLDKNLYFNGKKISSYKVIDNFNFDEELKETIKKFK